MVEVQRDERLSEAVRAIARALISPRPELEASMTVQPDGHGRDMLHIASPTGDPEHAIGVWDDHGDLGLEFGPWHTHGNIAHWHAPDASGEIAALVDIALRIVTDEMVVVRHLGGLHHDSKGLLDLRERDALLDELTRRRAPDRLRIETWSGTGDREVALADLEV